MYIYKIRGSKNPLLVQHKEKFSESELLNIFEICYKQVLEEEKYCTNVLASTFGYMCRHYGFKPLNDTLIEAEIDLLEHDFYKKNMDFT